MKRLMTVLCVLALVPQLSATSYTWKGGSTGYWGDTNSWKDASYPAVSYPDGTNDIMAIDNTFLEAGKRTIWLADANGRDMSVTIRYFDQNSPSGGNRTYSIKNVTDGTGVIYLEDPTDGEAELHTYCNKNKTTFNVRLVARSNVKLSASGLGAEDKTTLTIAGGLDEEGGSRSLVKTDAYDAKIATKNCTYSGGTEVKAGTLIVGAGGTLGSGDVAVTGGALSLTTTEGAINDGATLSIKSGATVSLDAGVVEVVGKLVLAGVRQPAGATFGGLESEADYKSEFFAGTGMVRTKSMSLIILFR